MVIDEYNPVKVICPNCNYKGIRWTKDLECRECNNKLEVIAVVDNTEAKETKKIKGVKFIDGYTRCSTCANIFHKDIFFNHIKIHSRVK